MCHVLRVCCLSSGRRHTRVALVTGVETCARPIWARIVIPVLAPWAFRGTGITILALIAAIPVASLAWSGHGAASEGLTGMVHLAGDRSEERRVGKECVSTCRSRWSQCH